MRPRQVPGPGGGRGVARRAGAIVRRAGVVLAVPWLLFASASLAQAAPRAGAAPARPASAVAVAVSLATVPAPPLPPQTARQFSESLLGILRHARTPSPCYASYIRILEEYAVREVAAGAGNAQSDAGRFRLAAHLRQMEALLTQMSQQAKAREEIRFGRTTLPLGLRQKTYAAAGAEHRRLLEEFGRMAAVLPPGPAAPPS